MRGDGSVTHRRAKQPYVPPKFVRGDGKVSAPIVPQIGVRLRKDGTPARSTRPKDNSLKPITCQSFRKDRRRIPRLDKRSAEYKLMETFRQELTDHVGGQPSATQKALIQMACWLRLKIELMDREIASGKEFGDYHTNVYLSWVNSLQRLLSRLGMEPKPRTADLSDYLDAAE